MASPFRTFRKNQKAWMVVLTILSMFAFVVLGSSGRMGSALGKREDPEIFTWDFGTVHRSDLNYRKTVLHALNQFLLAACTQAGLTPQQAAQYQIPITEQNMVATMLLDKKAEQMGIVVSDAVANSYINTLTENKLSPQELANIVRNVSQHYDGIGQSQLFDALRMQMAANYAQRAFSPLLNRIQQFGQGMQFAVFHGDTPGDRWDYFCRLNRKVTAQFLPVAVNKFVDQIPDPSPEQLKSFYEQYKTAEPDPNSPNPGFRQPFKAKFQYIKADYEQLLAAESPKITQQEIKDYYDNHQEEFKKTKLPELPGDKESTEGPSESKAGEKAAGGTKTDEVKSKSGETKSTDSKASDAKSSDSKSSAAKSDAGKSGSTKSSDSKSGDLKGGAKGDQKTGGAKSDAKSSDAKKSDSQKKSDDQTKSGSDKQSSVFPAASPAGKLTMTTSLNGEQLALADAPPATQGPATQAPATQPPAAKSSVPAAADAKAPAAKSAAAPSTAKSPIAKSADAKSAGGKTDAKSTDAKSSDAKTADTKSTDAKSSAAHAAEGKTPAAEPPVEYDPLDKVADTIRNRLAQQQVDKQVDDAFSAIESQILQYNRGLETYRAAVSRGNKTAKKPEPPDLTALAKPYGLEAKETDLVSILDAYNHTDLGKSRRSLVAGDYTAPSFVQLAYQLDSSGQPMLAIFQPQRSDDNDNNRYLWWKIADETARTPTLEEIKPEVTLRWKMVQARKPALAKANEDAAEARKLKETLKEAFGSAPDNGLVTAGPFSWLTQPVGQLFGAPRLTQVSGLEQVGFDFMKSVFTLKTSETGVAANEPQTIYYVVQIESEEPTLDALHEEFLTKMSNDMSVIPYAYVGAQENGGLMTAWFKEVQNEFGYQLAPGETLSESRSAAAED
ncbi:MAG TPA: hypothetical protein VFE46_13330 [Pirellulales bacterium]|jgi:hypothetical protein|nr:hypothetical protein [Pirellulales bacterium]